MTIEEKRKAIEEYCDKRYDGGNNCFGCPLFDFANCCWETDDKVVIERNYNMLFPHKDVYSLEKAMEVEKILREMDAVNHPSHYTNGSIECIDAMVAAYGKDRVADYCIINSFKYIWRSEHKNGLEDVKKAIWYLNKHVELKESSYEEAV